MYKFGGGKWSTEKALRMFLGRGQEQGDGGSIQNGRGKHFFIVP